jgi:hypothetical protein
MTYVITTRVLGEIGSDVAIAKVDPDTRDVWLWPSGAGYGPCIVMSLVEWERLRDAAESAVTAYRRIKDYEDRGHA